MTTLRGGRGSERDAREFPAEVGGVALAILRMVQGGVNVMKDVPLGVGRLRDTPLLCFYLQALMG